MCIFFLNSKQMTSMKKRNSSFLKQTVQHQLEAGSSPSKKVALALQRLAIQRLAIQRPARHEDEDVGLDPPVSDLNQSRSTDSATQIVDVDDESLWSDEQHLQAAYRQCTKQLVIEANNQDELYHSFMQVAQCVLASEFVRRSPQIHLAEQFIQLVSHCMIRASADLYDVAVDAVYPIRVVVSELRPEYPGHLGGRTLFNGLDPAHFEMYLIRSPFESRPRFTFLNCTEYPMIDSILRQPLDAFDARHKTFVAEDTSSSHDMLVAGPNAVEISFVPVGRSSSIRRHATHAVDPNILMLLHTQPHRESGKALRAEMGHVLQHIFEASGRGSSAAETWCFHLYWLFATLMPFARGSAGAAKVVLNAMRAVCALPPLTETETYRRQADWVAIASSSAEEFIDACRARQVWTTPIIATSNTVVEDNTPA